jgi:hypothetical protein
MDSGLVVMSRREIEREKRIVRKRFAGSLGP